MRPMPIFFCDAMEFHNFEDYWSFINGSNLSGNEYVLQDKPFTMEDMYSDHNFIHKFKTGGGYNYKIGVSGIPLEQGYAFKLDGDGGETCAETVEWNSSLRSHYKEKISTKYKFDAVIMHTYYEVANWEDIAINGLDPVTACSGSVTYGNLALMIQDLNPHLTPSSASVIKWVILNGF
jgi:hypothetical protein